MLKTALSNEWFIFLRMTFWAFQENFKRCVFISFHFIQLKKNLNIATTLSKLDAD